MQILLTVAYDGTAYAGWQRQQNAIAVQQRLEEALSALLNRPIVVNAASRTDAGVHALGQRAAFFADDLRVPLGKLPQVINGFLPPDISVTAAEAVTDGFNPRFDAVYKTYSYNTYCSQTPNPLLRRYSAYIPRALDIDAMKKAASMFTGRHDFAAFMATGGSAKTTIREIYACDVKKLQSHFHSNHDTMHGVHQGCCESADLICLTITGNGFLYNMVRIIAGTVLYVGLGKMLPEDILEIIQSCDRTKAGKTMPPEGLTLLKVGYSSKFDTQPNNM